MGQVLTNNTAVAVALEQTLGVLPVSPTWFSLEPNSIGKTGPQIKTTARNPISRLRQHRASKTTDLDESVNYVEDLTISSLMHFAGGFLCVTPTNQDLNFRAAPALTTGYTIPAATAAQGAKLQWVSGGLASLVFAAGYVLAANNGLKVLTADTAPAGVLIAVAGNAAETPPTNSEVNIAGIRAQAGDLALAVSGTIGTLSSGNNSATSNINFTTLGLTVGQFIFIGGALAANRFGSTASGGGAVNDSFGYARVRTIAAGSITVDKMSSTLTASDGTTTGSAGTTVAVDLLFGRFIRNVPTDSTEFLISYYQFELKYSNIFETDPPTGVSNPNGYEYDKGNFPNEITFDMPGQNKATLELAFIGTDSDDPIVNDAARKTNASTPIAPLFVDSFNTSSDFARLRIINVDESGLTTDLKDMKIALKNNGAPEKVLAVLGARFINFGNFEVSVTTTALFTNYLIASRIRQNTTVSMDWTMKNADGGYVADIPSLKLGDGTRNFTLNETVKIALAGESFVDAFFGTSFSLSIFPVAP